MDTVTGKFRLCRDQIDAEARLWQRLREGLCGFGFRRQYPIGAFIVDFCCLERRLAIELDGAPPVHISGADRNRRLIEASGYRVIRCCESDVLTDMDEVLGRIRRALAPARSSASGSERPAI